MKNYYKILGVSAQSTEKEIKSAYRKLAKKYHPDVVKEDPELTQRMYDIQAAYEVIGNEEKRKKYDEMLQKGKPDANDQREHSRQRTDSMQEEFGKRNTVPTDMSQFEQFFGFQPGKGMETYQDKNQRAKKQEGPIKPEELFASFFGKRK